MQYTFKKKYIIIFFAVQMACLSWAIADSQKEDVNRAEQESSQVLFHYIREGDPDPFKPFINQLASTPIQAPPMQNFTLVGVLSIGGRKVAMVEDASGKGYYLNKGSKIGSGTVSQIKDNEVRLIETTRKTTGRIVTKELIMYLKTEGDK